MSKAKAENKKQFSGKIAGLTVLEVLFYILSLPLIVILSAVFCVKTYEMVPYYSFWPFVGVILAGVLCLVFVIVVMCISLRKKSKRTILMQTVSIIVAAIMLTSFIAVLLDVILPDVLAQLTASTLFYEDLSNSKLAEEQADFNASLDRKFIMLNMMNGNYSPTYDYDALKANTKVKSQAKEITSTIKKMTPAQYDDTYFDLDARPYYDELFDFIYQEYVMTDISYALLNPDVEGIGNSERLGMAHAIAQTVYPQFSKLVEEGMSNPRIAELYENNYASLKSDGYLTYDDAMILFATSGRMTVPVVIRLLLDTGYTYTEDVAYVDEYGNIVEPDGTNYLELYLPEEVDAILAAAEEDPSILKWNKEKTAAVLQTSLEGYDKGAVIMPTLKDGEPSGGGYIRAPRKWSILDMDGKNMDVAAISDVVVNLGGLVDMIAGLVPENLGFIVDALEFLKEPMTLGEFLNSQGLPDLLTLLIQSDLLSLVDGLLQGITDVIMEATGGAALFLNLAMNDAGALEISISPTNVEVGMHGYQYMTWMESNNLLFAVISVMSLREWLYIFGAVSVLMAFAAGMCREIKSRVKKDVKENAQLAAAAATGESVATDDAETAEAEQNAYDAYANDAYTNDAYDAYANDAYADTGAPVAEEEAAPEPMPEDVPPTEVNE